MIAPGPKIAGCCTKCDAEVFEVLKRDPQTRIPVKLGGAKENAMRLTFILANGTRMDLTFCADCAQNLAVSDYAPLWRRVMASWIAQSGTDHPWVRSQGDNSIMALSHMQRWTEVL